MQTNLSAPRVMFISTGLSKGGAETQLVRLASELRRRQWAVAIASITGTCDYSNQIQQAEIDFFPIYHSQTWRPTKLFKTFRQAKKVCNQWKPDILISFLYHANIFSSILSLTTGLPSISSVRNERFGGAVREWLASLASKANVLVTINSANAAAALIQRGVLPADRTVVLPNAISVGPQRSAEDFQQGARLRWLAVGRLYPQKDYPNLLNAFRIVVDFFPQARLRIAGSGPLLSLVTEQISNLQLNHCVDVLGQRDDIDDLLRDSDALVLSSAWEGMPNVIMEAMANGLPVVATEVGGVPELVAHGETGLLCRPRDSAALAAAMLQLAKMTPHERFHYGEAGRQRIARLYSIDSIASRWEELLKQFINNGKFSKS